MKNFINSRSRQFFIILQAQVYDIPFGSKGNTIELEVVNSNPQNYTVKQSFLKAFRSRCYGTRTNKKGSNHLE